MAKPKPTIDTLLSQSDWHEARKALHALLLELGLTEEVKWNKLCYTWQARNIAIFFGFKHTCGLGFFKGALLSDPKGILARPGTHSQAMRVIHVSTTEEIAALTPTIRTYVQEAIALEKAGRKVDFKEKRALVLPKELQERLEDTPPLKAAFHALTPGRQRGYVLYISDAKKASTRAVRVERSMPGILAGKGRNDK
ncbi:YdeI family protein [Aquicoccus sp. G2-2]|uniref:YdeI/OmpD-associated family protein n=1 Tax=Aquicoccus sp. G2-2 TaxID=3092120 RepID=UPI002ADF7114|nr:YdeI/OmpD-associated family protein [Aquicoccus sp. G2-2]MEA1114129.1 YdeI/OmpD-associated family protein [Aquicoccus sp. G2-2]